MIRIHISAEWILSIGLLLALASAWTLAASTQAGYSPGIGLGITAAATSLALLIAGGRRM